MKCLEAALAMYPTGQKTGHTLPFHGFSFIIMTINIVDSY